MILNNFFLQDELNFVSQQSSKTNKVFKVNGHKLKPFVENFGDTTEKEVKLADPTTWMHDTKKTMSSQRHYRKVL